MSHDQVLELLFPLNELGGVHVADRAVEATALDSAQETSDLLLQEMYPESAYYLLDRWERTFGLPVAPDLPLQVRRNRVMQKMSEVGALNISYFLQLAASLGFAAELYEQKPLMAGWLQVGDELMSVNNDDTSNADWCWRLFVTVFGYQFRAGESSCGDALSDGFGNAELESVMNDLKPADTFVDFIYS